MMQYITILLLVLIYYGISMICHLYLVFKSWGIRGNFKRFIAGLGILYILFCIPYLLGVNDAGLVSYMLQIVGMAGYIIINYKKPFAESIGISAIVFIFVYLFIKSFFITSSQSLFNQMVIENSWDWTSIVFSMLGDVVLLLFVFWTHKKDISIWQLELYKNGSGFINCMIFIYIAIWLMVNKVISVKNANASQEYEKILFLTLVTFVGGLILLVLILVAYYRNENKNEKLRMQEAMILQQKMYIDTLENLQTEIKKFQHDYKNIVAGLYAVEKNSDTLRFLEKNILQFDETLSDSIRETVSLNHIKLEEIKGVILAKMLQAKKKGVVFSLEVIKDVECVYINIVDFNRCLGILIDNAIEAAGGDKKEVHVIMIQEEAGFVLIVKNTYTGIIQMKDIWQEGYSTKGEKRGIGLSNYTEILSKYDCVIKEARVEESYFVQILKSYAHEKGGNK